MLNYDKNIYTNALAACSVKEVDGFIAKNENTIMQYAQAKHITYLDILKQIRLHLSQFELTDLNNKTFFSTKLIPILEKRFEAFNANMADYFARCGSRLIKEGMKIKDGKIVKTETNRPLLKIEVREVAENDAMFIESKLHYLRSFRAESILRIGLFIKTFELPICYMSFCDIDRQDKIEAISNALTKNTFDPSKVIELSRVFGFGKLPFNTISFLVSQGIKHFHEQGYNYLITAVNPFLGFTGSSMLASGFSPFCIRRVNYQYSKQHNEYVTTRSLESKITSKSKMPPNILYLREIECSKISININIVQITENGISPFQPSIELDIYKFRGTLESAWNEKTRYHGTEFHKSDRPSKGQCGVSSMHLAKHLQSQGYEVKFCEGNVCFPEKDKSILNHCWIKLLNYKQSGQTAIIDITADQNGYDRKVIFDTERDLQIQGISYKAISECNIDEVGVEHLIHRLVYLESILDNNPNSN